MELMDGHILISSLHFTEKQLVILSAPSLSQSTFSRKKCNDMLMRKMIFWCTYFFHVVRSIYVREHEKLDYVTSIFWKFPYLLRYTCVIICSYYATDHKLDHLSFRSLHAICSRFVMIMINRNIAQEVETLLFGVCYDNVNKYAQYGYQVSFCSGCFTNFGVVLSLSVCLERDISVIAHTTLKIKIKDAIIFSPVNSMLLFELLLQCISMKRNNADFYVIPFLYLRSSCAYKTIFRFVLSL